MDLFEAISARASVRAFAPCEIADSDIETILESARLAPSGLNRQPCRYIVIRDRATIGTLASVQECIGQASAAIAVVVDENVTPFWKEDASAAIENMLLAVTALGFASVWIEGRVLRNESLVKEALSVPAALRLIAILPIGKAAQLPAQSRKKPLSELVYAERFGTPWNK